MPVLKARRCAGVLMILLAAAAGAADQTGRARPPQTFAGAPLDAARAAQLARAGGLELIDFRPCAARSTGCALMAVREPSGEAFVYEVSDRRCAAGEASCLGGYKASNILAEKGRGQHGPRGSRARVSAPYGSDGSPRDAQAQAQAEATNEILEALGEGKYDGDEDQFWEDLESIRTWTNPSWREPDPPPPVEDKVRATGVSGAGTAVLISGRYWPQIGAKECRRWVGYTSASSSVGQIGNWIGNALFDGCDSEVAVFSEKGAAQLIGTERRWSTGADNLDYAIDAPVKVRSTAWIVHAQTSFADEKAKIEADFERANQILSDSHCGIELVLVDVKDRTAALADPAQSIGCSVDTVFKPKIGFDENRMNVYVVNELADPTRAGVACTKESENVIVVDHGRRDTSLVHEYGHWFDLWHTNTTDMPLVDVRNVMSDNEKDKRDKLTAGQCYRASFSKDSYINKQGLRSGKTKKCAHLQDADDQCPGLKNEF